VILPNVTSGATFSECGRYRWWLWRDLPAALTAVERRTMLFVMLNPSTADAHHDDPTIRRCRGFAQREGCTRLEVVNLFSLRATDPRELRKAADPVGGFETDVAIVGAAANAAIVVVAWGRHGGLHGRGAQVGRLLADRKPVCLGTNADGSPAHPLYLPRQAPLVPWSCS
jgi:hypothetical protein